MIVGALMGSLAGGGAPSVTWSSINYSTVNEGQTNGVNLDFSNWNGAEVHWYLTNGSSQLNSSQVTSSGMFIPPTASGTYGWTFTFNADGVTDGNLTYYVRVEDQFGTLLVPQQGPFTCLDTSQAPSTLFGLEPHDWSGGIWPDSSGSNHPATTNSIAKVNDNGGALYFSSGAWATVPTLANSTFSALTFVSWIKPDALTPPPGSGAQVIFGKVFCYLLKIQSNGALNLLGGPGDGWSLINSTTNPGTIVAGQWQQVAVTIGPYATRIFVNGVKVLETNGCSLGHSDAPLNIGAYTSHVDDTAHGDFFTGYIGYTYMANFAMDEGVIATSFYNDYATRYGVTPLALSLNFVGSGQTYLIAQNTQSDWNLGSTFTIEFWSKGGNPSNGTIRTVASQGPGDCIDVGFNNGHHLYKNTAPQYAEPTPGVWTHVVYTGSGDGYCRLYYNGVYQTNWFSGQLSDGSHDLYIGKRGPSYDQFFYGKLAMLRISNTSKYLTDFTPTTTYGVESDTRLFLGKTNPLADATGLHPIDVHNVPASTDFPS